MYRNSSTTRLRCASVERSRPDPAPYRTSYGRQETSTSLTSTIADRSRSSTSSTSTSRMSRATSYDPFSSRTRGDYSTYTPRSTTTSSSLSLNKSRYGSTEQLTNSYKPPAYRSSTSSSTSSSSYTPRNVRAGSVSVGGAYDSPRIDSSLSRYRPTETPSYTSTLSKYRSTDKLASKYSSYRSPDNSVYTSNSSSRTSFSPSSRFSKSMSREKSEEKEEEEEEEDEVEKTFKKLYQKYVTDSEDAESDCESTKSLAEKVSEKLERAPLKRTSSASSITPRASVANSPNMTPKCSPLLQRKNIVVPESSSSSESESESDAEVEPGIEVEPSAPVKIATSIRINGKQLQENFETTQKATNIEPVRIKIRSKTPEISREDKKSESPPSDSSTGSIRRRRDPNRTLENLKLILDSEKEKTNELDAPDTPKQEEEVIQKATTEVEDVRPRPRSIPIPLVLITEPSCPNTPMATTPVNTTARICLWNGDNNNSLTRKSTSSEEEEEEEDEEEYEDEEVYSSGDWTSAEDEEEEEEEEYGSSDCEFSVSQTFSLKGHLPFGEMFPLAESTSSNSAKVSEFDLTESYLTKTRKEESRGRVDSLFAVPAPTFTCSVSYDDQEEEEVDDDDENWLDDVHSCDEGEDDDDFRVVPICDTLRPTSSSLAGYMSPPGSMTSDESYDGRTVGCTLKLLDRAAAKESDEDSEYYEDEEFEEDEEEYWDEEYEEEEIEEEEEEVEGILEEYYEDEEVSCESAEDLTGEEDEEEEEEEEECLLENEIGEEIEMEVEEALVDELQPFQFELMTVSQVEEMIEEASCAQIPEVLSNQIDQIEEVENYIDNNTDVNLVPTFVRQMTENVKEEMTSRFASERKPATDFAKKAVIQPAKFEKVKVGEQVQTKIGEQPKRKIVEEKAREDKSAIRKSALNMKEEDAKKKALADEKAAQQKARRFGTVSAISGKFNEDEEISYKKSTRLEPIEKPKRTYEVIKPEISDDFDKQMKELREQMKDGQTKLQTKMKDLSKGIHIDSQDAKIREMSEKRRITSEKTSGTIGKVEEEKARFRAARDASVDRIEAEKHLRKKKILIDVKKEEIEKKPEPKRTIRRWKPPPPDPNAVIPSFSSGPTPSKPTVIQETPVTIPTSKPSTPTSIRKKIAPIAVETPNQSVIATRIRNNGTPTSAEKRYSSRRKTQEIVNESVLKPKQNRRKVQPRKKRFTRPDRDVDLLLGFQLNATFEQLEKLFEISSFDKRNMMNVNCKTPRRRPPTKTFISNLTDIDKIYKASEIRDIIASINLVY